jgi:hypothetical protein
MILPDALDALSGEERRRLYGMLRLEGAPMPEGLEIAGVTTGNPARDRSGAAPLHQARRLLGQHLPGKNWWTRRCSCEHWTEAR